MFRKSILICCFLLIQESSVFCAQLRSDLSSEEINRFICGIPDEKNFTEFFSHQIYSAGLSLTYLNIDQKPTKKEIKTYLSGLLARKKHNGYRFGFCNKNRYYALTSPASYGLKKVKSGHWQFPVNSIKKHCKKARLDFASVESLENLELDYEFNKNLFHSQKSDGFYSLTCWPKSPRWLGPMMWYLFPSRDDLKIALPKKNLLQQNEVDPKNLLAWINAIRKQKKAPLITFVSKDLIEYAEILSTSNQITHDSKLIDSLNRKAKKYNLKILGENRVIGPNNLSMAMKLWMSPRHRRLLLNPKANQIGISEQKLTQNRLIVILIGSKENTKISKK